MIYVFNKPDGHNENEFIYNSLKRDGISRFGWSYRKEADLTQIKKHINPEDGDLQNIYKKSSFLLLIQPEDWVVHINIGGFGNCIAGIVEKGYFFDNSDGIEDFKHCLKLRKDSIIEFNRNDPAVIPLISRRLKLRGHYWRIYDEDLFFKSIHNLRNDVEVEAEKGVFHLKELLEPSLAEITSLIQKTHPEKNLESLVATIFRQVPGVVNVHENGSGWKSDFGADLIIDYSTNLAAIDLQVNQKIVVQVKSYTGHHFETNAVNQLEQAINKYEADAAVLITTAKQTEALEKAIEELQNKTKPIKLIAGSDVAKFLLKFGSELVF